MMPHKEVMIKLTLEKSAQAIKSANDSINSSNLETAQNRIYYAIFYSVLALAYKSGFVTAKHKQLMGWFNKKFIYEEKVFDETMLEIYKKAFTKRLKSDYEIIFITNQEELENLLNEAIFFIGKIKAYLN